MRLLRQGSLSVIFLLLIASVAVGIIAACGGPTDPDPTSAPDPTSTQPPAATTAPDDEPEPTAAPEIPDISGRDWNVLGFPDALVTVLDYSDFQ